MKKIKILMPLLMLILLTMSCENADKNPVNQVAEKISYIDISAMDFVVEYEEKAVVDEIPQIQIIITSEGRGNLMLTTEPAMMEIEKSEFKAIDIPETAVFALNTYYAGDGYYYYGKVEDNRLKVYRKAIEEMSEKEFEFELFKTYAFTANREIEE